MLLGLAAGKVGDLVFYRDGGEQRTRTRVVPKNPRSIAQMTQRVKIANVSATYRLLKSVIADSFTGRPSNQSGYNAFASSAIDISPFLSREQALADYTVPAPYVIARGTIAPLSYSVVEDNDSSSLNLAIASLTAEDNTMAAVSAKMLAAYPYLQQGDIITFVGIGFNIAPTADGALLYRGVPAIASMKIDTTDETSVSSSNFEVGIGILKFAVSDISPTASGAVVVSRVDGNGALQTSFAELALTTQADSIYSDFRDDYALNAAVESYGVGGNSILRE